MDTTVDHFTPLVLRVRGKNYGCTQTGEVVKCHFRWKAILRGLVPFTLADDYWRFLKQAFHD